MTDPFTSIPAELRSLHGWLVWRSEQTAGETKPRKVPYYADGVVRHGKQGGDADRRRLASFDEACAALLAHDYTGLGLAMLGDWGLVGLDFDNCVKDGQIAEPVAVAVAGTYSELSPSGTGVRAFVLGTLPDRKSRAVGDRFGFETFCTKGFLTITGQVTDVAELTWAGRLTRLNGTIPALFADRFGSAERAILVPGGPPAQGLSDAELRRLLSFHDPDAPYRGASLVDGAWISVGMALHHETQGGERGLDLWVEHSERGTKYPGRERLEYLYERFGDGGGGPPITANWLRMVAEARGGSAALDDSAFAVVPEARAEQRQAVETGAAGVVAVERRGIPQAKHLCTDQANANRLVKAYGSRVLVAAGRWHVWDGCRWKPDEADVYRYACRLSEMVRDEARDVRRRAREKALGVGDAGGAGLGDGSTVGVQKADEMAEALEKWSTRCESKGTIEAAIGLARKMLTVDAEVLDRDPWLLNVRNGVVDLRTGELRGHEADDYITKLADVEYRGLDWRSDLWEQAVSVIAGREVGEFLRRWFGYCATGLTREQVFVVHWGDGANGKSTVLDTVGRVLGDYAGVAAPGLVASDGRSGDRHPTEIAALWGRRMVTAHESREGVQLREDFVKQATGGDKLVARFMREDFFEFAPTHKLQLLTNAKPVVKGQDHGVWRRVRLVAYGQRFGSAEDVAAGRATGVRDVGLMGALGTDEVLSGVLSWIVRGAVEWAAGGLQEPSAVLEASEDYRREQDRVGQWVSECCEVDPGGAGGTRGWSEPLTLGMGGLFPSYTGWCREGGYHGLARGRFAHELQRVCPGIRIVEAKMVGETGKRRKVLQVQGIRLLPED